ncbi:MAG: LysM peptidoglycan-binding domain-containing protein, partial [Desulfobacterium sp.]
MKKTIGNLAFIFLMLLPMTGSATPAIPGTEMVETDQGPVFYYTIQKGDTLWDLSQKFYNSQWVWPGLWEMNHQIKNPHLIYPGNRI